VGWVRATELVILQNNGGLKRVADPARPDGPGGLILLEPDGTLCALINECPHVGGALTAGHRHDGWIECPLHTWRFDVRTGMCLSNPGEEVATLATRVVDGFVEVEFL
jgi:nitrite reductase/ring-hydroxylating ferredoxin subunit